MAEQAKSSKVQFGLKNVHIAVLTDEGEALTYADPFRLRGAVEIELEPAGESNPFYADDSVFYTAVSNQGYTGKLTIAMITDQFCTEILGDKIDDNGSLVESNDNTQNNFAMMFEFDGDASKTRHVLYNVSATRPTIAGSTKEDKTEPNTQELEFTAAPDPYTGNTKKRSTATTNSEEYETWFTKVPVPTFTKTVTDPKPEATE